MIHLSKKPNTRKKKPITMRGTKQNISEARELKILDSQEEKSIMVEA